MTAFAKFLVFANLVFAAGVAIVSTSTYTERPGWFDTEADSDQMYTFKRFKEETDSAARAAALASRAWGTERTGLVGLERTRDYRRQRYTQFLGWARTGITQPVGNAPVGTGFFILQEDPSTGLYDVDNLGAPVDGPTGIAYSGPLRGSELLLDRFNDDADAVARLSDELTALRAEQARLGVEVRDIEVKLAKQREIRDELFDEASYLGSLEVNVAQDRETARRRLEQLKARIATFTGLGE